jgi:hypothetical protein
MFPGLDSEARMLRGVPETKLARFFKNAAYYTLFTLGIPFAAFEAACNAGATVMLEARKKH